MVIDAVHVTKAAEEEDGDIPDGDVVLSSGHLQVTQVDPSRSR